MVVITGMNVDILPETLQAVERAQQAHREFISCPLSEYKVRCNNYFACIHALHAHLFPSSKYYMHRGCYFREAKKILGDGGRFKWYLFSRYRLHSLAQDYVGAFNGLSEAFSLQELNLSTIRQQVHNLEKAHRIFAMTFAKEYEFIESCRQFFQTCFRVAAFLGT